MCGGRRPGGAGPSFVAALGYPIAWVVICLVWWLPPVLNVLARYPVLAVPEAATLCAAGIGLWLELIDSPPRPPRLPRPQRACVAVLVMWSIWVIAYILGFASHSVVHAYDRGGSHLLPVDDQEITAFVLWLAAAVSFLPVVFTAVLTWLKEGSGPAGEVRGDVPAPAVRGWGTPRARPPPRLGPVSGSAGQRGRRHAGGQRFAGHVDHGVDGGALGVQQALVTMQLSGGRADR